MKKIITFLLFFFITGIIFSQVGIGTPLPNNSAQLEIVSNDKGVLIPRIALSSSIDVTTITNGNVLSLLVFNTATTGDITPGYHYWDGSKWQRLTNADAVDATDDAWVNNPTDTRIELGTKADGITARDTGTEMVVTDDGKVAIGLTDPLGYGIRLITNDDFTAGRHRIASFSSRQFGLGNNGVNVEYIANGTGSDYNVLRFNGNTDAAIQLFELGGSPPLKNVMYFDNNGNIGVGIDTPASKLEVATTTTNTETIRMSDGTDTVGFIPVNADPNGSITGTKGSIAMDYTNGTAYINTNDGMAWSEITSTDAEPWFGTDDNAGATDNTEDMYVLGNIAVGIATPTAGKVATFAGDVDIQGVLDPTKIIFSGDGTVGSFDPTANNAYEIEFDDRDLRFTNSTAEDNLVITQAGNVGIGTSLPTEKLHVVGNQNLDGNLTNTLDVAFNISSNIDMSTANKWGIVFNTEDASGVLQPRINIRRDDVILYNPLNMTEHPIVGSFASNRTLTLQGSINAALPGNTVIQANGGNVGIGTTAPTQALHLHGDTTPRILLTRGDNDFSTTIAPGNISLNSSRPNIAFNVGGVAAWSINSFNGALQFATPTATNANMKVLIDQSGNVGIGTSAPTEKLEVNGKIKAVDINFSGLPIAADEVAATGLGLTTGDMYMTVTGELRIKL